MNLFRRELYARTVPVAGLGDVIILEMFRLLSRYYDNTTLPQFETDLRGKDHVILLFDGQQHRLRGFSTVREIPMQSGGRRSVGVFSGDTVVEKAYWGQRVLGKAFLRHLCRVKIRSPLRPVYWLLISKGYKTYLLMANNFAEHYPRHERETPAWAAQLMDTAYRALFRDAYDPEKGLISFPGDTCRLREGVAAPDAALARDNARVAFFLKRNAAWIAGDELACLARFRLAMPLTYQVKSLARRLKALRPARTRVLAGGTSE